MEIRVKIILIILFISGNLFSQDYRNVFPYYYDIKELNANYIHIPNNNYGFLTVTNSGYPNQCSWLRFGLETIVYEQGLFLIGKMNNEIYLSEAMWGSLYSPGPILDDEAAMNSHPEDSLKYRVYKISKGDSNDINIDMKDWPIEWGAPITNDLKIKLYGDQMLWTIYNSFDQNCVIPVFRDRSDYPTFPLEIHQIVFAYDLASNNIPDFLKDVIFFEYTIINKGYTPIDSAYVGLWTDIDFYGENNYPAVDPSLQLGYCWSDFTPNNPWYDSTKIPSVGYLQLFGPSVNSPGKTATFKGEKRPDYKNLDISAFWGFHDDSFPDSSNFGPAYSRSTAWNIARGYNKSGKDIIDPFTNKKTTFRYSGDPVNNTGWLANKLKTGGGAGFYIFSGPFNLAPMDTQWVMYALIAARGTNNLGSIDELRRRAGLLQELDYNELVKFSGISRKETIVSEIPAKYSLNQNYPNPFNNGTTIKYDVPRKSLIKIELFNLLGQNIAALLDEIKRPGSYIIKLHTGNLSSGVYFYKMVSENFSAVKKMILLK